MSKMRRDMRHKTLKFIRKYEFSVSIPPTAVFGGSRTAGTTGYHAGDEADTHSSEGSNNLDYRGLSVCGIADADWSPGRLR